mmetsp:Transcript_114283/g.277471  ORF Transcript_114283/g.277471 Transcript_114283/m.277471 type:complete len:270 (-) Transcript_114283:91-900(-)
MQRPCAAISIASSLDAMAYRRMWPDACAAIAQSFFTPTAVTGNPPPSSNAQWFVRDVELQTVRFPPLSPDRSHSFDAASAVIPSSWPSSTCDCVNDERPDSDQTRMRPSKHPMHTLGDPGTAVTPRHEGTMPSGVSPSDFVLKNCSERLPEPSTIWKPCWLQMIRNQEPSTVTHLACVIATPGSLYAAFLHAASVFPSDAASLNNRTVSLCAYASHSPFVLRLLYRSDGEASTEMMPLGSEGHPPAAILRGLGPRRSTPGSSRPKRATR